MKKIALMGGTFNPIHIGHLIGTQAVYETGLFDEVWLLPSGNPPHKDETISGEDRLNMCRCAVMDNDHFKVSDFELKRSGKIYSVDTFELLSQQYDDTQFYLIIGTDSLLTIHKWYQFEKLMSIGSFVVVDRGGYDNDLVEKLMNKYSEDFGTDFIKVSMPLVELSSSNIRKRIIDGLSIDYRVPDAVRNYIIEHNLYR